MIDIQNSMMPIRPDWPAPDNVSAWSTTRSGGVSDGPWRSLNLGAHVGDDAAAVVENRTRLLRHLDLPSEPHWLEQVHGTRLTRVGDADVCADACFTDRPGEICVVMTADCLPVLFCNRSGTKVAAAHAGWRGLLNGVLEQTVSTFSSDESNVLAWLGPAIGPRAFEVGEEVRAAFVAEHNAADKHFAANDRGRWMADLYGLAGMRLARIGVQSVHGGSLCTYSDATRFFSYRRDGFTGRMASLIWMQSL